MSKRLAIEAGEARLDRRPLSLRVWFDPFSLALERAGGVEASGNALAIARIAEPHVKES